MKRNYRWTDCFPIKRQKPEPLSWRLHLWTAPTGSVNHIKEIFPLVLAREDRRQFPLRSTTDQFRLADSLAHLENAVRNV
jgi:hypothetical protein